MDEEELRACTVGELRLLNGRITVVDYDPQWPTVYFREEARIGSALQGRALSIEHAGSTAVPGLPAKPVIDVLLVVADAGREESYVPALARAGYELRIREPEWYEHRMLTRSQDSVHLHVFSAGCPEVERMLIFRDWLRENPEDRALYGCVKKELALREWKYAQNYADAKTAVLQEIMTRALASRQSKGGGGQS